MLKLVVIIIPSNRVCIEQEMPLKHIKNNKKVQFPSCNEFVPWVWDTSTGDFSDSMSLIKNLQGAKTP